jgi:hypothetical protein
MKLKFNPGAFVGKKTSPAGERVQQPLPKRHDETPRTGRPLSAAETAKVFREFVIELQREFFPTLTDSNATVNFVIHPDRASGFGQRVFARHGLQFVDVS